MSLPQEYWDTCKLYEDNIYNCLAEYPLRYVRMAGILKALELNQGRLLEVGCLTGYGMEMLEGKVVSLPTDFDDLYLECWGIEIYSAAIEKKVHPRIIKASAAYIPFPDKHFDVVISIAVLEHIHRLALKHVLNELERVGRANVHTIHLDILGSHKDQFHISVEPMSFWWLLLEEIGVKGAWYIFHEP